MILLDTHVWVRWLCPDDQPLPVGLQRMIDEAPELGVSVISVWEVAWLQRRGRLALSLDLDEWLVEATGRSGIGIVNLTAPMVCRAAGLTEVHRDPADRFIIATALELGCPLISLDQKFPHYPELREVLIGA